MEKINLGKDFYKGIGEKYKEDKRYYRKTKDGNYEIISLANLLKDCYPDKYELWKEKERVRYKIYYQKNNKKIKCKCGCNVVQKTLEKHKKTKKHKKRMERLKVEKYFDENNE